MMPLAPTLRRAAVSVVCLGALIGVGVAATTPNGSRPNLVESAAAVVAQPTPSATVAPTSTPEPQPTPESPTPLELDLSPEVRQVTLPQPEELPLDPYENTPAIEVATIRIPALGIDQTLWQGMSLTAINRGPSQWPGSALPGELGNMVIAGHRTTYGAPFRYLDLLVEGDLVEFDREGETYVYAVTGTEIVDEYALHIADQTAAHTATLFACHPPGSAAYRIVVHLQLLDANGRPVDDNPLISYEVVDAVTPAGALPGQD
ncbi:MAG: sortase [Acidimicrobiales bacterium]|nr:sortase [Acidimicrobiales bacterium]